MRFVSITTSRQSLSFPKHTKKAKKYLIAISFKNTCVGLPWSKLKFNQLHTEFPQIVFYYSKYNAMIFSVTK